MSKLLGRTYSICPVCGKQLPAERVWADGAVYLRRICPEHGPFSAVIWRDIPGGPAFPAWLGNLPELEGRQPDCAHCQGLCAEHQQGTCCLLYEVTSRCDLACAFCFAAAGGGADVPLAQVLADIDRIYSQGRPTLQLSGGEPTLRDDLPEIVAHAAIAGAPYIQLNSNGLRLAEDEAYVAALAEAGLSFVFMQFDGVDDTVNIRLRGKPLLQQKLKAVEVCARHGLGVTLVPTLVPGVNTEQIGALIRLAVSLSPAVRGIHFQPVSYFGRYPSPPGDEARFTLSELLAAIPAQTDGLISLAHIAPSHCDHALCGFHGGFIVEEDGSLTPLTQPQSCCCQSTAEQNRDYVGRRWSAAPAPAVTEPADGFDVFLRRARERAFTLTAMAFQDAGNLDLERLRRCSLHVYGQGRIRPFCAHYLSLYGEQA